MNSEVCNLIWLKRYDVLLYVYYFASSDFENIKRGTIKRIRFCERFVL